mgnify:CR=1 FL=1
MKINMRGDVVVGLFLLASLGCGGQGGTPTQPALPSPTPTGSFTLVSSTPAFGGQVSGQNSDLQGTSGLTVTLQTTSLTAIPSAYFVLELLNGTTECLRTQIAYCTRTDGGVAGSYAAGESATYRCAFFLRDNQQASCGAQFTTNRMRFILQARGSNDVLLSQEAAGGWSFVFSR